MSSSYTSQLRHHALVQIKGMSLASDTEAIAKNTLAGVLNKPRRLVQAIYGTNSDPQAIVLLTATSLSSDSSKELYFDWNQKNPRVKDWLYSQLECILSQYPQGVHCLLPASYQAIGSFLMDMGMGISHIELVGDPVSALSGLKAESGASPSTFHRCHVHLADLKVRKLTTSDLSQILSLETLEYAQRPDNCWYFNLVSDDDFLKIESRRLLALIASHRCFGLFEGNMLRGFFGYQKQNQILWRDCATIDIFLCQSIQGLGLAKTCYVLMFQQMIKDGIQQFCGTTSNPAILHLSHRLGRTLRHISLRSPLTSCPDPHRFRRWVEF